MNVLVTGGAGYIGSILCRLLLEDGNYVRVIDNLSIGIDSIQPLLNHPRFELMVGDITNERHMDQALKQIDKVFALGAIVGDAACQISPQWTEKVNYLSTELLIQLSKKNQTSHIIFASSCSVYGAQPNHLISETSPLNPVSLYAQSRVKSEHILLTTNIPTTILRLSTVFGWSYRMRFDLVINLFAGLSAKGKPIQVFGGKQYRPFVHVRDAAAAFKFISEKPMDQIHKQIFNVGTEANNQYISDIAFMISEMVPGTKIILKEDEVDKRNYRVDFSKIRGLGYSTQYSIRDGIEEIISELNQHTINLQHPIYNNLEQYKLIYQTRNKE